MSFPATAGSDDCRAAPSMGVERYRGALDELIDMGMDLARMVHRRARVLDEVDAGADARADARAEGEAAGRAAVAEATVAFDRIARTVRRTVSLVRALDAPVPGGDARASARRQIIRVVEDTIAADHGDGERAELYERMDGPELEEDLDARPVQEIIDEIRRDLGDAGMPGVRHPWKRRTPAEVAVLCARARGAGLGVARRVGWGVPGAG